jgi:hypothetical protein
VSDEEIRQTAPVLAWEIALRHAGWWFQRLPNGGMALKLAPLQPVPLPNGAGVQSVPAMPGVEVLFDAAGWRLFQDEVAAGEKKPLVPTATIVPPGVRR